MRHFVTLYITSMTLCDIHLCLDKSENESLAIFGYCRILLSMETQLLLVCRLVLLFLAARMYKTY